MKYFFSLTLFAFVFTSCSLIHTSDNKVLVAKTITVTDLFTTSINSNASNSTNNLFDKDSSTIWTTANDNYIDEGIKITFADSMKNHALKLISQDTLENTKFICYFDNVNFGIFNFNDTIFIQNSLKSIYFRFVDTSKPVLINNDIGEKNITNKIYRFKNKTQISVSEIEIYDENKIPVNFILPTDSFKISNIPDKANSDIKNSILSKILNKRIKNHWKNKNSSRIQSIIINDNGTFGTYKYSNEFEIITSGKWKATTVKDKIVKLNLTGKEIINIKNPLALKTFEEEIQIYNNTIEGENYINLIYFEPTPQTFVDVSLISDDFAYDMKYATADNFVGEILYDCPKCLLRYEVAKEVIKVNKQFMEKGFKIKFFDCYRPFSVQQKMWKILPNRIYVADPNKRGSVHNRGGAVDITLVDINDKEVEMGTKFDFFGREAFPTYTGLTDTVMKNRQLLMTTMQNAGFTVSRSEWWHYSHPKAYHYKPSNIPLPCD